MSPLQANSENPWDVTPTSERARVQAVTRAHLAQCNHNHTPICPCGGNVASMGRHAGLVESRDDSPRRH
jgi:hypothetical protein